MRDMEKVLAEMMKEAESEALLVATMLSTSINTDFVVLFLALMSLKSGESFGLNAIDRIFEGSSKVMEVDSFKEYKDEIPKMIANLKQVYTDGFKQYYAAFKQGGNAASNGTGGK